MFGFADIDDLFAFGPYRVAIIAYSMFLRLWYFLAIGIIIGAVFSVFLTTNRIKGLVLKNDSFVAILIAALLGAISPLGSYAMIPIFTIFLSLGIPLATVMTFLTASPMINPYMFYITWQLLGLKMALARTASAILVGTLTGLAFKCLVRYPFFKESVGCSSPVHQSTPSLLMEDGRRLIPLWKDFIIQCFKMTRHATKWFAFSIILAAIVDVYVPSDWIVRFLGGHAYSLLLAAAMAIPFYVCGGGAVPLIWDLIQTGMSQGAALTFFIAGPVTRIAPMATIIALVRFRAFMVYILVSMFCAIAFGYLYHFI